MRTVCGTKKHILNEMPCYHPLKGFPWRVTKDGKVALKITPYNVKGLNERGEYIINTGTGENDVTAHYEIPCGHCIGCRQDQAKEWSDRLIMEMEYNDSAYFITLTYDDVHMKRVMYTNKETGELKDDRGSLDKRDVQLFIKRLRKAKPGDSIRYYICGEYGPRTNRPHYHGIIYGLHLGSWHLIESGRSETGNIYYTCAELESLWRNGFISIEPANEYTCKYVTSYVTKKIGAKPNRVYEEKGQVPPFALMSRKPGIGRRFFDDNGTELVEKGTIYKGTNDGSVQLKPPRYFKKLYREGHEDSYQEIVAKHLIAASDMDDARSVLTDNDKLIQLRIKEQEIIKKQKQRYDL